MAKDYDREQGGGEMPKEKFSRKNRRRQQRHLKNKFNRIKKNNPDSEETAQALSELYNESSQFA